MITSNILTTLDQYQTTWVTGQHQYTTYNHDEEYRIVDTLREFANSQSDCFARTNHHGHFTGSALVVTGDFSKVLLTLHGKLNLWLQLGGHADGHPIVADVARREAEEKSGLADLTFFSTNGDNVDNTEPTGQPFDLDFHHIPATAKEPAHIHYDVRFLMTTKRPDTIRISNESKELSWFSLAEARTVTNERSMHRQFDKVQYLKDNFLCQPNPPNAAP